MSASMLVYLGLAIAVAGLVLCVRPCPPLRVPTRRRAASLAGIGIIGAAIALALPAPESRVGRVETRLDEFAPVWQFREFHTARIAAPPAVVFDAITAVRPDEIFLFRTLIWIRSAGQPPSPDIRHAVDRFDSLLDIATHSTFVRLADDPPRELVVGTLIAWPSGERPAIAPELFRKPLPPGFTLGTMNFIVTPDGDHESVVSTETRVFANSPAARRRFAAYWRVIYPGSAVIRRMWLRAIERRVTSRAGLVLRRDPSPTRPAPYSRGAILSAASAELMTGCTSKSTMSRQLAIQASSSAGSSVSINW